MTDIHIDLNKCFDSVKTGAVIVLIVGAGISTSSFNHHSGGKFVAECAPQFISKSDKRGQEYIRDMEERCVSPERILQRLEENAQNYPGNPAYSETLEDLKRDYEEYLGISR